MDTERNGKWKQDGYKREKKILIAQDNSENGWLQPWN